MKKLLTLIALMFCLHVAKAQYTTVNVINTAGIPDLYIVLHAHGPLSPAPCAISNTIHLTGPLSGTVPFNIATATWAHPGVPASDFIEFTLHIIPPAGPRYDGGGINACVPMLPPTPLPYSLGGTTYNISLTSPAPGILDLEIL